MTPLDDLNPDTIAEACRVSRLIRKHAADSLGLVLPMPLDAGHADTVAALQLWDRGAVRLQCDDLGVVYARPAGRAGR